MDSREAFHPVKPVRGWESARGETDQDPGAFYTFCLFAGGIAAGLVAIFLGWW